MGGCDLCGKELSFFSRKVPIKYNHGTRTVCKNCFEDLQRTDVQFEDFCTAKRWLCFLAIYGPVLLVFIVGMVAIGVTQCAASSSGSNSSSTSGGRTIVGLPATTAARNNNKNDRDTGCFLGMFLFGFFGQFN